MEVTDGTLYDFVHFIVRYVRDRLLEFVTDEYRRYRSAGGYGEAYDWLHGQYRLR